ncbi:MAG: hypothetical protein QM479_10495 [Pseudomonadota bacterium]
MLSPRACNNVINFNAIKKQSTEHKLLEMVMRDSNDNIEEFAFQMFLSCDVDSIDEFEILSDYQQSIEKDKLKAQA